MTKVSDITLIDTYIIFEILANVNRKEGKNVPEICEIKDGAGITDYEVSKQTGIPTSTLTNGSMGDTALS